MLEAPLIKMVSVCEERGYEVIPIDDSGGFRFTIWKDDSLVKTGTKVYKNWNEGQSEVYNKLYKAIIS